MWIGIGRCLNTILRLKHRLALKAHTFHERSSLFTKKTKLLTINKIRQISCKNHHANHSLNMKDNT
jgi:hypothetical protein